MNTNPAGVDWFTPKSQLDKAEEDRARYRIRGLVGTEAMDVKFETDDEGHTTMTSRGGNACLRAALIGWENRKDANGNEIFFQDKDWKANVASLNPIDAIELSLEIWNRTFLTEEARKN